MLHVRARDKATDTNCADYHMAPQVPLCHCSKIFVDNIHPPIKGHEMLFLNY